MAGGTEKAAPGTALQRAGAIAMEAGARFRALDSARRNRLIAAVAIVLACFIGLLWFGTRTEWRTLYAGLNSDDARQMGQQLTAAGIPFDVSPDGTAIRVPAPNLDKARLIATAAGGPRSGRMGFEIFDKPNWMGSEFDEQVNYQRALEGELERTIDTLDSVESARVHLVLHHDSLFADQQREAKASVVLRLRHANIPDDEVQGVANLVASAVDGLRPENVVIVNADGGEVLDRQNSDAARTSREKLLAQRVIETLEPVAGVGNVRATVSLDYKSTSADETDEMYDPSKTVTLSMQSTDQTSGQQTAAGVPGTASNAPTGKPPLYPPPAPAVENLKQQNATYGASRMVRHTTEAAGGVRRLSVAVLINFRPSGSAEGSKWQPRSAAEMKQLSDLAAAAVGFDASRGDQISLEEFPFEANPTSATASKAERLLLSLSRYSLLLRSATVLLSVVLLLFLVVRPALRSLTASSSPRKKSAAAATPADKQALAGETESPAQHQAAEQRKLRAQNVFEQVSEQVKRDPAQSTRLLESWIRTE